MIKIQVMGPGCPKCKKAAELASAALAESGIDGEVIKITDFQEIAQFGVFSTPALAVDGEIKAVGKVPSKAEILSWLS